MKESQITVIGIEKRHWLDDPMDHEGAFLRAQPDLIISKFSEMVLDKIEDRLNSIEDEIKAQVSNSYELSDALGKIWDASIPIYVTAANSYAETFDVPIYYGVSPPSCMKNYRRAAQLSEGLLEKSLSKGKIDTEYVKAIDELLIQQSTPSAEAKWNYVISNQGKRKISARNAIDMHLLNPGRYHPTKQMKEKTNFLKSEFKSIAVVCSMTDIAESYGSLYSALKGKNVERLPSF